MHVLRIVPIAHQYDAHATLTKALHEALEADVVTAMLKACCFALSLQLEA